MSEELLSNIVNVTFNVLYFLILIRVLMSWLPQLGQNPFGKFVGEITDPILAPIKRLMPKTGMIDLSPIIAFLLLSLAQNVISSYL